MEEKELVECLVFLITKYIDDDEKKIMLIDLVKNRGSSVGKAILHEINKSKVSFDPRDSDIIKDIAFHCV
ncbi:MAG TPA: hypothetical protein PLI94_05630 [Bacillota bacterium]|jgi:hypothetical protein|nr:hypothetical protein [Bacillota bacterium]HPT67499.1 hypothetical protein [Bacillota bacterium]